MKVKKKIKIKIDKKQFTIAIILGLMCFLTVYLTCIQFKTVDNIDVTELETMRENELRTALADWKEKYEEVVTEYEATNEKINEYNSKIENDEKAGELITQDLENAKMLLGLTDVEGTGIIITMTDNSEKQVDSTDLLDLVNELNSAGAEAISINGQRIVPMTDIFDVDNFIVIKGKRITSPYVIKAIGDVTYLQSALSIKKGYLDEHKTNGYTISLKTEEKITINKYDGEFKSDYIK